MLDVLSPQPVVRRLAEGATDALERLSPSAVDSGQLNLIALDAVAQAFGARWSSKKDQVYEHVERVLARAMAEDGYFVRVSGTDFLVVQPSASQFAAQAVCCRSFQEIWSHFLGKARQTGVSVHRVTGVSAHEITAVEVDQTAAMAGEAQELAAIRSLAALSASASTLSPELWSPFVASTGRRVDVVCRLEPVFSLKTNTRIALRLRRQVVEIDSRRRLPSQEIAGLSRSDLFRIDMATLSRGLTRLRPLDEGEPELSLIVPVSYISLSHPPSRQGFVEALEALRSRVQKGVICEVYDLADVPHATLAVALSILRPECLLVAGYLPHDPPKRDLRAVGLQAVSVSCPKWAVSDQDFVRWLRPWIRAGHVIARSVMVYNCSSAHRMAIAGALGATHCSGPLGGEVTGATAPPDQFRPAIGPVAPFDGD